MQMNLKHLLGLATLAAAAIAGPTAAQAADIGVSVSISQPGVYGRVDIGRFPQPVVFVQQPVVVHRTVRVREPVYMWVPAGHRQNWSRHCGQYGACGAPVYFVRDSWYEQKVRRHPGFRDDWRRDDRGGRHHGWHRDDRGRRYDDRRDGHDGRDGRYSRDGRHGRDD